MHEATRHFPPEIHYQPRDPRHYRPAIGLIGCGGITQEHLTAYRDAGYQVTALCDLRLEAAMARRDAYFPEARVTSDYHELLRDDSIEVVDIATHPPQRPPIIEDALRARKHVLSQKPFVLDLDLGERLADLADANQVRLAVNQNGRWAPHYSYLREAIANDWIGQVAAVHMDVHWDHTWVTGTEFEKIYHLILYDFAIHWFDLVQCFLRHETPQLIYATTARWPTQQIMPPLLAQAVINYDSAQASLAFDASVPYAPCDRTYIAGTQGTLTSEGIDLFHQQVTLTTPQGTHQPHLSGRWFPTGFHGTMGELLCSIEENREPTISARRNLNSLALCFAAVASAQERRPVVPGSVRQMPSTS